VRRHPDLGTEVMDAGSLPPSSPVLRPAVQFSVSYNGDDGDSERRRGWLEVTGMTASVYRRFHSANHNFVRFLKKNLQILNFNFELNLDRYF
jgi:hypothetical protein